MRNPLRSRWAGYFVVAVVASAITLGTVHAATTVNWGYLLAPQSGVYSPHGSSQNLNPLSISSTTIQLASNGSWYALGLQTNQTAAVDGFEVFLNVSGGAGQLAVYNMTATQFSEVKSNQSFTYEDAWLGINSRAISLRSTVFGDYYYVLMNTAAGAIAVTYTFNAVPISS